MSKKRTNFSGVTKIRNKKKKQKVTHQNIREKKNILEIDHAFGEEINRKIINDFSYEDLYESGGVVDGEVKQSDQRLDEREIKELQSKFVNFGTKKQIDVESLMINRNQDIKDNYEKLINNNKLENKDKFNDKRTDTKISYSLPKDHFHIYVELPKKIKNANIDKELYHLRYLNARDQFEIFKTDRYNSYENYIENKLFQEPKFNCTVSDILTNCFENGRLELIQFEFSNFYKTLFLVFIIDYQDEFYLSINLTLPQPPVEQFKTLQNDKIYVWKELSSSIEITTHQILQIIKKTNVIFQERYYFSCNCLNK